MSWRLSSGEVRTIVAHDGAAKVSPKAFIKCLREVFFILVSFDSDPFHLSGQQTLASISHTRQAQSIKIIDDPFILEIPPHRAVRPPGLFHVFIYTPKKETIPANPFRPLGFTLIESQMKLMKIDK